MANPYLAQQGAAITRNVTDNFQQNVNPGINGGAQAAGGFGGSRQGIAQGLAMSRMNQDISGQLSNMYGQAYEGDQNRSTQSSIAANQVAAQERMAAMQNDTNRFGLQNSYNLGLGNLGLGNKTADQNFGLGLGQLGNQRQQTANQYTLGMGNLGLGNKQADQSFALGAGNLSNQRYGMDQNYALGNKQADNTFNLGLGQLGNTANANEQQFYTQNRQLDQNGLRLGADLYNQGNAGYIGQGQGMYDIGRTEQQAPWGTIGGMNNAVSPYTGLGVTNQSTTGGGGAAGAAGGALAANQMYRSFTDPGQAYWDQQRLIQQN